ncbi:MAG: hypothetical protein F6K10_11705 [Moorea sp. SIO2B7]|nr:hypothetical protein [Moorena sp. SIO2B7]
MTFDNCHVLAVAIKSNVEVIVAFNLRDFAAKNILNMKLKFNIQMSLEQLLEVLLRQEHPQSFAMLRELLFE